jgi:hypothetical protein
VNDRMSGSAEARIIPGISHWCRYGRYTAGSR